MKNNKKNLLLMMPTLLIICMFNIVNNIDIDGYKSEAENRTLAQKPTRNDLLDKTYFTDYDNYYTDQFVGREKLLKIYTLMQVKMDKTTVRDYYINKDNWIMEKLPSPVDTKTIEQANSTVKEFKNKVDKLNKKFVYISTPHKSLALQHIYPEYEQNKDSVYVTKKIFEDTIKNSDISMIELQSYFQKSFSKEELEKFYFKTDHHWNAIGGFEGFKYLISEFAKLENLDIDKSDFDSYKKVEPLRNSNFMGSYNKNLYGVIKEKEEIPFVLSNKNDNKYKAYKYEEKKLIEKNINEVWSTEINSSEYLPYGGAYAWDIGYYKVVNENALIDKKVMVFRDSYQATTARLFADIFKEVEVVDTRNVRAETGFSPEELLNKSDSDYVFMMYNDLGFYNILQTVLD